MCCESAAVSRYGDTVVSGYVGTTGNGVMGNDRYGVIGNMVILGMEWVKEMNAWQEPKLKTRFLEFDLYITRTQNRCMSHAHI